MIKKINEDFVYYTTWNRLSEAIENLPDNYEGLNYQLKEDIQVRLIPIRDENDEIIPDWLEVEIQNEYGNYDTIYYVPTRNNADEDGYFSYSWGSTGIHDWIPEELHERVYNREGVAVHIDVLDYLKEEN